VISDWLAWKVMGNHQVAGALKRAITKISMVGAEISVRGHCKQPPRAWKTERRKKDNGGPYETVTRAWGRKWKSGIMRKRESF
jgi:hypothetical protein